MYCFHVFFVGGHNGVQNPIDPSENPKRTRLVGGFLIAKAACRGEHSHAPQHACLCVARVPLKNAVMST